MVTTSHSISSFVTALPLTWLKSCLLTPLNTILLPLIFISPLSSLNSLNPTLSLTVSIIFPSPSTMLITSMYRLGVSALHSFGSDIVHENLPSVPSYILTGEIYEYISVSYSFAEISVICSARYATREYCLLLIFSISAQTSSKASVYVLLNLVLTNKSLA